MLLMTGVEKDWSKTKWYLDSGCLNHICSDEDMFDTLEKGFVKVRFGGIYFTLVDVYYIHDLKCREHPMPSE